jgi:integrase
MEIDWEVVESAPESESSIRNVAIDAKGVRLLNIHAAGQAERTLKLGNGWDLSERFFTNADGSPLRPSWITKRFRQTTTAAGLPPIRWHDRRHTAATLMPAAGIDVKLLQETLGHSSASFTSDTSTPASCLR